MRSNNLTRSFVVAIVALASALALATPAPAADGCSSLSGVVTASWVEGSEGLAWYGQVYLSIGGAPVVAATLVDVSAGEGRLRVKRDGSMNYSGEEHWTVQLADGDSFQIHTQYSAVCGLQGLSCELHETGRFIPEAGTGRFGGVTGHVSIEGPYAGGDGTASQPWIWISRMSGAVCTQ